MSLVDDIQGQIRGLSSEELRALRVWFAEYDAELWDRQFEADVPAGRLERLAVRALRDHEAGLSTKL
jgi:hypothetical protein